MGKRTEITVLGTPNRISFYVQLNGGQATLEAVFKGVGTKWLIVFTADLLAALGQQDEQISASESNVPDDYPHEVTLIVKPYPLYRDSVTSLWFPVWAELGLGQLGQVLVDTNGLRKALGG